MLVVDEVVDDDDEVDDDEVDELEVDELDVDDVDEVESQVARDHADVHAQPTPGSYALAPKEHQPDTSHVKPLPTFDTF